MPHHVYGLFHLTWLAGIVALSAALSVACRRNLIPQLYVRAALICLLIGGELQRYRTADLRFPETLPLNLCNVTTWVAVIAGLTLSPAAVEFAYFVGLSGAGLALLTPEKESALPVAFFLNHGAIILTGSVLIYGRIASLRRGAMWRAYAWFWVYIGVIALFDWRFGVNYAYLRHKPGAGTLLDFLGPYPSYLFTAGAVGLALLWLLWLPTRTRPVIEKRIEAPAISHAERS